MKLHTTSLRAMCASAAIVILALLWVGCTTQTPETVPTTAAAPTESQTDSTPTEQDSEAPSRAEPVPTPSGPAYTRLETVVPPCIPWPGSSVDPCKRRDRWEDNTPNIEQDYDFPDIVPTFEESLLDWGLTKPFWATHFVVRATVIPGSTRCGWTEETLSPYRVYDSGYSRVVGDGLSHCYYELAVNEYLHGAGPARLTVLTAGNPWGCEGNEDKECLIEGARYLEQTTGYEGVEWIMSLGGPWNLGTTVWRINGFRDVQRREDDEIVVVRKFKDVYLYLSSPENYELNLSRLEWTLDDFRGVVADAFTKYKTVTGGRTGTERDRFGRLPPFFAEDAGPAGFNDYIRRTRLLEGIDITPSHPPPVPDEADPNSSDITINDVIATRVAGGAETPGGLTNFRTPTPESAEVPTGQE